MSELTDALLEKLSAQLEEISRMNVQLEHRNREQERKLRDKDRIIRDLLIAREYVQGQLDGTLAALRISKQQDDV